MRCWIAGFLFLCGQFAGAKTKMLVEDPNNVVAGRYSLTAQQERQATATAEALLNSLSEANLQKALAVRLVAVDASPLTEGQARKEPESLRDAQERLARYGVSVPDNQPLTPIVIYDTQCHRIIHGRLYTVTELPRIQEYGRFDDDTAVYLGGATGFSKEGYKK
jgi:hypothetical protein